MSAKIYRIDGHLRLLVATFEHSDDALRCFKSITYNLGERLVMVTRGNITVPPPNGCHQNGIGEYVLNPALREDVCSP